MIRRAKLSEITDILLMTKACTLFMESQGIYQWTQDYPSREIFNNDIKRKELFVLLKDDHLIGTIVISTLMDEEYTPVKWLTPNDNNIYIHRLGVHPEYQGQGNAQQLMNFAENYARENNVSSIRLDTFSQNKRNQKFYEKRGYQKLENIFFPKQSKHPFPCYELVL